MQSCSVLDAAVGMAQSLMDYQAFQIEVLSDEMGRLREEVSRCHNFIRSTGHTWNSSLEEKVPEDDDEDDMDAADELEVALAAYDYSTPPSPPALLRTTRVSHVRNLGVEFDAEAGVTTRSRARMRNLANTPPPVNIVR